MARRKRKGRRGGITLPLAAVAGFMPLVGNTVTNVQAMGAGEGLKASAKYVVPWDASTGRFTTSSLGGGLFPIIAGFLVHKVVGSMLGVNRALARARVPFVRL